DPLKWAVYAATIAFVLVFSWIQMQSWLQALAFTGGVVGAFLMLGGMALLLMRVVKRTLRETWGYLWRQGFANVHRPNNQTVTLVIAIGLGTFFMCTLYIVQDLLVRRVSLSASDNQPNMVLFDIQEGEKDE